LKARFTLYWKLGPNLLESLIQIPLKAWPTFP
jgi:hypothetical protein